LVGILKLSGARLEGRHPRFDLVGDVQGEGGHHGSQLYQLQYKDQEVGVAVGAGRRP